MSQLPHPGADAEPSARRKAEAYPLDAKMLSVDDATRRGAYGIAVAGLTDQEHLLVPAPEHWPEIRLEWRPGEIEPPRAVLDERRAVYPLDEGGYAVVERAAGTATFVTPEPPAADELLHPRLAMVAAVCASWLGSDAFHAGAFEYQGRAWAVVAEGYGGKSSVLAALHARGVAIVADDTLVIRDGVCLSGARCIDLRDEAHARLGLVSGVTSARRGQRRRLAIGAPPAPAPLGGWVFLRWGDRVDAQPIPASDRLELIGRLRGWHRRGTAGPDRLLELASLPAFELRRPRDWALMPNVLDSVADVLRTAGQPGLLDK